MHETVTSFNLAPVLINLPKYAILIIVMPMLAIAVLKFWLAVRASSKEKPRKEWALSQEQDEAGIPLLAKSTLVRQPTGRQSRARL